MERPNFFAANFWPKPPPSLFLAISVIPIKQQDISFLAAVNIPPVIGARYSISAHQRLTHVFVVANFHYQGGRLLSHHLLLPNFVPLHSNFCTISAHFEWTQRCHNPRKPSIIFEAAFDAVPDVKVLRGGIWCGMNSCLLSWRFLLLLITTPCLQFRRPVLLLFELQRIHSFARFCSEKRVGSLPQTFYRLFWLRRLTPYISPTKPNDRPTTHEQDAEPTISESVLHSTAKFVSQALLDTVVDSTRIVLTAFELI
mmetsp:Transcript_13768/g.21952  ORF Transcript_13768/g.21952 Transcript_13768/m.21952 type:complete len:255 (-) Transcript_13768:334-1098(-)